MRFASPTTSSRRKFPQMIFSVVIQQATFFTTRFWMLLVSILVAGAIPCLWHLGSTAMWTDEMLTYHRVTEPLSESFDSMTVAGNQTPLYYLALRLLPKADPLWLRLPSVAFGLLDIVLLAYLIVRLYGDKNLALQVAALIAIHPMHIILSRTARYYTLLLALTIPNLLCFVLILRGSRRQRLWVILGLSSMVAYLTHYTTLALPAAQLVTLLMGKREQRRLIWKWGIVQFLAVLPLAIWMSVLLSTHENTDYTYLSQVLHLRDLPLSWLNIAMGFDSDWSWVLVPGGALLHFTCIAVRLHLPSLFWARLFLLEQLLLSMHWISWHLILHHQ